MATRDELLRAALALPAHERLELARSLLDSLAPHLTAAAQPAAADTWLETFEHRVAAITDGAVALDDATIPVRDLPADPSKP